MHCNFVALSYLMHLIWFLLPSSSFNSEQQESETSVAPVSGRSNESAWQNTKTLPTFLNRCGAISGKAAEVFALSGLYSLFLVVCGPNMSISVAITSRYNKYVQNNRIVRGRKPQKTDNPHPESKNEVSLSRVSLAAKVVIESERQTQQTTTTNMFFERCKLSRMFYFLHHFLYSGFGWLISASPVIQKNQHISGIHCQFLSIELFDRIDSARVQ